jgi:hypothetical protein
MSRRTKAGLVGLICVAVAIPTAVVLAGGNASGGEANQQYVSWSGSSEKAPRNWKPIQGGAVASSPGFVAIDVSAQMKKGKAKFRIVPVAGGPAVDPGPVPFSARAANSFTWAATDTCGQGEQHQVEWKRAGKRPAVASKVSTHTVFDDFCF